jgi:hypothetical protein
MMLRALRGSLRGLGEAIYDDEGNYMGDTTDEVSDTGFLAPYPKAPIATVESPIPTTLIPTTLDPISITGQIGGQTYDQYLASQAKDIQSRADAANATLKALTASGASIAQLALAKSAVSSSAAELAKVKAQQLAQAAAKANPVSGCSVTIIPGLCDTYVYIGGAAAAGLLLMLAMKGGK